MALDNPSYFSMANPPPLCSLSSSVSSASSTTCSSPHSQSKRSMRSLLRSLSTNSADSNHELFNTGAPRLSDIAPEFKYASEPRRANSLKSKPHKATGSSNGHSHVGLGLLTDVHRLYSPLPQSEIDATKSDAIDSIVDGVDDEHEDEVFVTREDEANVRYYNVKSVAPRRHSISTLRGARSRSAGEQPAQSRQRSSVDLQEAVVHATIDGQSAASSLASRINLHAGIDDHKLRHGSYPRKRCNRCPRGGAKRVDMEDILIISAKDSEPANLWAQYFVSYFEQISQSANRKPYKIRHLGVEEIITSNGEVHHIAERTASVKLQLIILCPVFLERIQDNSQYCASGLSKLLLADRILALQLGTSDDDVSDLHKEAFPSYLQWQRRPVGQDQDQNFAHEFVASAIAIFTKIWKQQSSMATEENSQFSIAPKKIRYGQTSVLIMLEYPLLHEDIVKISIVKNEEMTEIKNVKRRNPYTMKFTIPEKFLEVSAIVNILVEKNGSFIGKRPIKCESRLRELEQILRSTNNPVEFMCQVSADKIILSPFDQPSGSGLIQGIFLLEHLLKKDHHWSLGFSPHDTEQLDNWLVHMFQKNVPPSFNLFANNDSTNGNKHVCELFPTLLHFSARFGLETLTSQLLDCPGGDLACEIRNVQDFTPADIAENVGHKEINNMLKGYMKMNELATVYTKIKKLTTDNFNQIEVVKEETKDFNIKYDQVDSKIDKILKTGKEEEEHYLTPKKPDLLKMDEFYKMCPAPKPVNFLSKSAPSTPSTEETETPQTFYIPMDQQNSPKVDENKENEQEHNYQNFTLADNRITSSSLPVTVPETSKKADIKAGKSLQSIEIAKHMQSDEEQTKKTKKHKHHLSLQSIHSKHSTSKSSSTGAKEDKVQVELAEIINDFKNNVHTIAQTEQLVAEWQNRNDVRKSFKEKQEQLKEMRMRYEQIQRDMKHNSRKSSPFERFKKIFGFSHHNSYQIREREIQCGVKCIQDDLKELKIESANGIDARPISSLSLQSTASSASSGTMSTISGCSLGDSGTHSDHEERKIILTPLEEDHKNANLNHFNNYLIPPTPRPIQACALSLPPSIDDCTGKDKFERMDPFYIQFPPNGLPVSPDEIDSPTHLFTILEKLPDETKTEESVASYAHQQEYMNLPSCSQTIEVNSISTVNHQHDYMNFKTAS